MLCKSISVRKKWTEQENIHHKSSDFRAMPHAYEIYIEKETSCEGERIFATHTLAFLPFLHTRSAHDRNKWNGVWNVDQIVFSIPKRATSFIKEDFCMHGVVRNVKLSIDCRELFLYLALLLWMGLRSKERATNVSIYGHRHCIDFRVWNW